MSYSWCRNLASPSVVGATAYGGAEDPFEPQSDCNQAPRTQISCKGMLGGGKGGAVSVGSVSWSQPRGHSSVNVTGGWHLLAAFTSVLYYSGLSYYPFGGFKAEA